MPRYLVTYHGGPPPDPETMIPIREAFIKWVEKTGPALVDPGAPVHSKVTVSTQGTSEGAASGNYNGWSVVEAADINEAATIIADHPFIGRGGELQVNEPVPI